LKTVFTILLVLSLCACSSTSNNPDAKTAKAEKEKKTSSVICDAAPKTGSRMKKRGC
jgi:hypothetical protein